MHPNLATLNGKQYTVLRVLVTNPGVYLLSKSGSGEPIYSSITGGELFDFSAHLVEVDNSLTNMSAAVPPGKLKSLASQLHDAGVLVGFVEGVDISQYVDVTHPLCLDSVEYYHLTWSSDEIAMCAWATDITVDNEYMYSVYFVSDKNNNYFFCPIIKDITPEVEMALMLTESISIIARIPKFVQSGVVQKELT